MKGAPKMQSRPDESVDEEDQPPTFVEEGVSGDEEADSDSKGSRSLRGASGETSSPNAEEHSSRALGITRVPLEVMLKGLIISQIRAPFIHVEEGLHILLKECLIAEHPFFSSASLSGHVDHFQSVDDEDLGWGCGWRNIQILCSFLLAEDPDSREVLFNGAGFVPDIPALQIWLEIAWAKGFDKPGAEYFNWAIAGTRKWIGTTECAALLRSFGVGAKIVSFTSLGGKRVRPGSDNEKARTAPINLSSDDELEKESVEILNQGIKNWPDEPAAFSSRGGAMEGSDEIGELGSTCDGHVNKDSQLCDKCLKSHSQIGPPQNGELQLAGIGRSSQEHRDNPEDAEGLEDTETADMSQIPISLPAHGESSTTKDQWNFVCDECRKPITGRRYKSIMAKHFDLCSNCMKDVVAKPTEERGSHHDYVIIEEHLAIRNSGPAEEYQRQEDLSEVDEEHTGVDQEETSEEVKVASSRGPVDNEEVKGKERERGGNSVDENDAEIEQDQKTETLVDATPKTKQPERAVGPKPLAKGERGKAGMHGTTSGGDRVTTNVNHHHLIEWVWSYFTEDSTQSYAASSPNSRDFVHMSKRSPLYFQHRGHSRTIVGIQRRREPTGMSEDVHLLVLDPSVSTELLVKCLREKSGWQKLIAYDVHTLKETEYQLCYVDPGIAVGEELEQLKVLSSLRYSYYSK